MKYDIVIFREFTQPEINRFLLDCNFTKDEESYLLLRCKGLSNVQIAMELNVSESQVSKLCKRVKVKIKKIL